MNIVEVDDRNNGEDGINTESAGNNGNRRQNSHYSLRQNINRPARFNPFL